MKWNVLCLRVEENAYRTTHINQAVVMICTLEAALKGYKKGQTSDLASLSKEVIRIGFEKGSEILSSCGLYNFVDQIVD